MNDRTLTGHELNDKQEPPDEGFVDRDGHYRNKWGAIPGYCPCGNALDIEEMDWNDGLCDECAADDDDDGRLDEDSDDVFDD